LGFASLQLSSGLILHNCCVQYKKGSRWISIPAKQSDNPSDEKSWAVLIEFAIKEAKDKFQLRGHQSH
jgi:hypothetical protein